MFHAAKILFLNEKTYILITIFELQITNLSFALILQSE